MGLELEEWILYLCTRWSRYNTSQFSAKYSQQLIVHSWQFKDQPRGVRGEV